MFINIKASYNADDLVLQADGTTHSTPASSATGPSPLDNVVDHIPIELIATTRKGQTAKLFKMPWGSWQVPQHWVYLLKVINENSNSISCPLDSNVDMKLNLKMWANQFIDFGLQL